MYLMVCHNVITLSKKNFTTKILSAWNWARLFAITDTTSIRVILVWRFEYGDWSISLTFEYSFCHWRSWLVSWTNSNELTIPWNEFVSIWLFAIIIGVVSIFSLVVAVIQFVFFYTVHMMFGKHQSRGRMNVPFYWQTIGLRKWCIPNMYPLNATQNGNGAQHNYHE